MSDETPIGPGPLCSECGYAYGAHAEGCGSFGFGHDEKILEAMKTRALSEPDATFLTHARGDVLKLIERISELEELMNDWDPDD